jgi:hypothetical protein
MGIPYRIICQAVGYTIRQDWTAYVGMG